MILDKVKNDVKLSDNLRSQKFQIQIDSQTIKNLIANYSKPQESCIRELCMNAYESHMQAGKATVPFKVHAPNKLEPWFAVEDEGIGLSQEDMFDLYGCIGKSSKRSSNDFTGCFGIGSKAAYAITNIFTVESSFEGKRYGYICHLDEDGIPCIAELPNNGVETNKPNGFKVKFDVADDQRNDIIKALKPALRHFDVKPILNIGIDWDDEPKTMMDGPFYKVLEHSHERIAIMGQIGYPINSSQVNLPDYGLHLNFDIGDLEVSSSREELMYTEETRNKIETRIGDMKDDIEPKLQVLIDKEDCDWNKALMAQKLVRTFRTMNITDSPPYFDSYLCPLKDKIQVRIYANSRWNRHISLSEIGEQDTTGIKFVLNDIKRGAISRCKELLDYSGVVVLIEEADKAKAILQFGILEKHLILASDLPKPEPKVRNTRGAAKTRAFQLNRGERNRVSYAWAEKDIADIEEDAVYCVMDRYNTFLSNKGISPLNLNKVLNFFEGQGVTVPKIYGIKKEIEPEDEWVPLQDWVDTISADALQKHVNKANAPSISKDELAFMQEIFDIPNVVAKDTYYDESHLLSSWFDIPEPDINNEWETLMDELFFYQRFRHDMIYYDDKKAREAFIVLAHKYVKSVKIKEKSV